MNEHLKNEKKYALKAARELGYSDEIMKRIKEAKTENQILTAMTQGRHEKKRHNF